MGKNGNLYELEFFYRKLRCKVLAKIDNSLDLDGNFDFGRLLDLLDVIDKKLVAIGKSIQSKWSWRPDEAKMMFNEFNSNKKSGKYYD